ncbi:two component transcriptional regulator, LuxR family [Roseibium suaedae]|uniref:Two component transcriptional regulator, LuxR family n=2 Tax=Roseibium suaedae TaxID=735517 RepID=A0A1M7BSL0_9HYPH|nr:two component transcriptional regulator, LuxR family [Roseibium suaedae]
MMMIVSSPSDTVLVVDDTPSSLGMLTHSLEEAGYTVLVAPDGQRALDIASRITPNAILMDAVMPNLDGFETVKRLKRMDDVQNVPVIFMTGLSDTENIVRGLEAGGVDYVTKPVNTEELLARLRVHIANARNANSAHLALDVSGRFLLSVTSSGKVCWNTPQARSLLGLDRHAEDQDFASAVVLPQATLEWLRASIAASSAARPADIEDHFTELEGTGLRFTYVGAISSNEYLLRVAKGSRVAGSDALRQEFSLTEREAEVLTWIASGKSNKEIASILDMSPRTVNKHLDRIFAKLGVENRTAAAILSLKKLLD